MNRSNRTIKRYSGECSGSRGCLQELTYFNQRTRELHGLPLAPVPMDQWPSYYNIYQPDGETLMKPHEIPLMAGGQD